MANAPIVEAVLHWQARASNEYRPGDLLNVLRSSFPDYQATEHHNLEAGFSNTPQGIEFKQRSAWKGVRLTQKYENDRPKFVCQFLQQGISFSRLAPYTGWDDFEPEAQKFWQKHCELGDPGEVARLSVRFISQIPIASADQIGNYIETVCEPLHHLGLSANSYYHQDTIELTNEPYVISIVRTVQPTPEKNLNLIVDITASTSGSFEVGQVDNKLRDLRFIKNKVFFNLMKDDATQKFGES